MKKLLLLFAICPMLFISCGHSREKKAEAIAQKVIPKMLNDASSYEPVQTSVDSAFESIYLDPAVAQAAYELIELKPKKENLQEQYDEEKSSAEIWSDPYSSNFGKEELRQSKEKMNQIAIQLKKLSAKEQEQVQIIKKRNREIDNTKFIGWVITHRFRCKNGAGVKLIQDMAILVDEKMENTLMIYNLDENADDGFDNIKETVDDVIGG